jgi:RimJ/RimL family protein N-acetyltransferase
MADPEIKLTPVAEPDLEIFRRFATEPGLIGLDWTGFRDAQEPARRYATDGYLSDHESRLMVVANQKSAGFVNWRTSPFAGWEIGIALLPEQRGQGIGWRAQAMLCDYLFHHTPAQRIQAATHPENTAEQKSLLKAGFHLEGRIRACEFRAGQWRDGLLYSRLRTDQNPL